MNIPSFYEANNNTKAVWFRQLARNPVNTAEKKIWECYTDFENEFIEKAYQRKDSEVSLNDCSIDFQCNIQRHTDGKGEQIPIKREEIYLRDYVRQERFCDSEGTTVCFDDDLQIEDSFFFKWLSKNSDIKRNFATIANLAAEGISKEGKLLNQEFDAQRMVEHFCDGISQVKNLDCAARLYTAESFLYKLVNGALRSNDMSKIDTLGPFCYLLYCRLRLDRTRGDHILYRGATLTMEMLDKYRDAVGKTVVWRAFTSTSKDRRVAEMYGGNTVFIISAKDTWRPQNDISKLSYYPDEQEVLLSPFYIFTIHRFESESYGTKYRIYMSTLSEI